MRKALPCHLTLHVSRNACGLPAVCLSHACCCQSEIAVTKFLSEQTEAKHAFRPSSQTQELCLLGRLSRALQTFELRPTYEDVFQVEGSSVEEYLQQVHEMTVITAIQVRLTATSQECALCGFLVWCEVLWLSLLQCSCSSQLLLVTSASALYLAMR